ncbi:MAG: hypothetical protein A2Z17_04060 [Gammaproteobacteria bacterium RBG_16_66_13]|nr:MAG: hypothetical protein A2Z17_04060 [Gammaproteobacteria bacterium RBG_16_66_13]
MTEISKGTSRETRSNLLFVVLSLGVVLGGMAAASALIPPEHRAVWLTAGVVAALFLATMVTLAAAWGSGNGRPSLWAWSEPDPQSPAGDRSPAPAEDEPSHIHILRRSKGGEA